MKIMIATDIHGSKFYAEKLIELFKKEKADKLILLGDLYYHGPRNPLTKGYAPLEVSKILNGIKDKLLVVKGNCDSEVDEMISEFPFQNSIILNIANRKVFFTHGHKYNIDNLPSELNVGDVIFYGHFHNNAIYEKNGITAVNVSSLSLPMNNSESAYAVLTEKGISIKNLDSIEIMSKTFTL